MKTIRDRTEHRIVAGIGLAVVSGLAGRWLTAQLLPETTGHLSRFLCVETFGIGAAWLGWRLGIVAPDLGDRASRTARIVRVRSALCHFSNTLIAPSTWVTGLFAAVSALSVGLLIEDHPADLVGHGMSAHRHLSALVAAGVVRGAAFVAGGWLGYQLQRIAWDDDRRDEVRGPNR